MNIYLFTVNNKEPRRRLLIRRSYAVANDVVVVYLLLTLNRFHVVLVSFTPCSSVSIFDLEYIDVRCLGCDYKKQQVTINNRIFYFFKHQSQIQNLRLKSI